MIRTMHIRFRVIAVIVSITLAITIFSSLAGIFFVKNGIEKSQEKALVMTSNMADRLLSLEIESLKNKAGSVADELANADPAEWPGVYARAGAQYPQFIGITVFGGTEILAFTENNSADAELCADPYFRLALATGSAVITSTCVVAPDSTVIYIVVPMPGTPDGAVAFTIDGMYFHFYLKPYVIWESGHIFVIDNEGYFISNPRTEWISSRQNLIVSGEADVAQIVTHITQGGTGIGRYYLPGVVSGVAEERICAYRPIEGSAEGWGLGVVAPLTESPSYEIDNGLIVAGAVGFILSIIVAFLLSGIFVKPYKEADRLKVTAEENSRVKSAFLANMSHEIRTPMNAITGMSELLGYEKLTERQMGYVNDINISAHALLDIINDILDMSKIESGKFALVPVVYSFGGFIDNITSMTRYIAKNKGLDFEYEIIGDPPEYLYGDDKRLRQALVNLCGNAVKFTETGCIKLTARAEGNTLAFIIKDTGTGIRKEDIPTIFDAYSQVDRDKHRKVTGTGLGLSISKAFIEMMGGDIMVESEYGHGATFTILIPIAESAIDNAGIEPGGKKEFSISAPMAKILLVDDNEFNLRVAYGMLGMLKIDAEMAASGIEAIELVKEKKYDMVLMDHMMPEMDGIEATREIRKLGGEFEALPIVALTANAVQGAKEMFLANRFNDFISKPIDPEELKEIIIKWLPDEKIKYDSTDDVSQERNDDEFQKKLYALFMKSDQNKYEEISGALASGDTKLAHRLSHTLKGNAGQIGKTALQDVAAKLEDMIRDGTIPPPELMDSLKTELNAVFDELRPICEEVPGDRPTPADLDIAKSLELLDELEPMLESFNSKCTSYIDEVRSIPGAGKLAEQIEDYDFEAAALTLAELRSKLSGYNADDAE